MKLSPIDVLGPGHEGAYITDEQGDLQILAHNQGGHDQTVVPVSEVLVWLRENDPSLLCPLPSIDELESVIFDATCASGCDCSDSYVEGVPEAALAIRTLLQQRRAGKTKYK